MIPAFVLLILVAGCFGSGVRATATGPVFFPGYNYDGAGAHRLQGTMNVSLDASKNSGSVVVHVFDDLHTYHLEMSNFTGREGYQSGGVVARTTLFGDSHNGSAVFPKVYVYAAAWGSVRSTRDGVEERDPSNLFRTLPATFFLARGHYRDNATERMYAADGRSLYDPAHPKDARVSQFGAQAALLVYTSRGDMYRYVEFNDVRILAS